MCGVHHFGQFVVQGTQLLREKLTQVSGVDDGVDTGWVSESGAQQDPLTGLDRHPRILQTHTGRVGKKP